MLRLTVSPEEYLMIGDNVKIVFLGGTKNYLRIMVDAPKDINIVRSAVLEAKVTDPEERAKMPKYYREPEYKGPRHRPGEKASGQRASGQRESERRNPEFRKAGVIIARGNADRS